MVLKKFHEDNVRAETDKPAVYRLYGRNRNLLYVGHSSRARHRLQSYYQQDDPNEHPTKFRLRPAIKFYHCQYVNSKGEAMRLEREIKVKEKPKHNYK